MENKNKKKKISIDYKGLAKRNKKLKSAKNFKLKY
jgi:hypothetical protein